MQIWGYSVTKCFSDKVFNLGASYTSTSQTQWHGPQGLNKGSSCFHRASVDIMTNILDLDVPLVKKTITLF